MNYMKELAMQKIELLLKDLEDMIDLRQKTGKTYFTEELIAVRVKEIEKILKGE